MFYICIIPTGIHNNENRDKGLTPDTCFIHLFFNQSCTSSVFLHIFKS